MKLIKFILYKLGVLKPHTIEPEGMYACAVCFAFYEVVSTPDGVYFVYEFESETPTLWKVLLKKSSVFKCKNCKTKVYVETKEEVKNK